MSVEGSVYVSVDEYVMRVDRSVDVSVGVSVNASVDVSVDVSVGECGCVWM